MKNNIEKRYNCAVKAIASFNKNYSKKYKLEKDIRAIRVEIFLVFIKKNSYVVLTDAEAERLPHKVVILVTAEYHNGTLSKYFLRLSKHLKLVEMRKKSLDFTKILDISNDINKYHYYVNTIANY